MSKVGSIWYRCRKCRMEFSNLSSPDWHASLVYAYSGLVLNPKVTEPQHAELFTIHQCKPDDPEEWWGLADLIGAKS